MPLRPYANASCRSGPPHEIPHRQQPVTAAQLLKAAEHDALHVRDVGLQAATDSVVLERARADDRVLISADTDFGSLLAHSHAIGPSVLLIRRLSGRRAADQFAIVQANLAPVADDLAAGAIVVLGDNRVRVRRLPLPG